MGITFEKWLSMSTRRRRWWRRGHMLFCKDCRRIYSFTKGGL